ncbi:MAG: hypothetical protein IKL73_01310 [Lachnospiraceae bacterium]|nr:hypothetical protein [Lachnospira sp.]MBQ8730737.1 hypothetical protein [Lachnospiraceae bacterium]MBR6696889.1 hypothetical protein [Lachnospiraceae bacterium]
MDIKEMINDVVEKITKNDDLIENFKKDPIKTVESVAGIDLPDGVADKIADAVNSKISVDKVSDAFGKLKKLF